MPRKRTVTARYVLAGNEALLLRPPKPERRYDVEDRGYYTKCWIWHGRRSDGYGKVMADGKHMMAHVLMWEHENGPVPAGLELDHLCRVRQCANPSHLEAVTHEVNIQRGANAKLTEDDVYEIRALASEGARIGRIADRYGVSKACISDVVHFRSWRNVA
jgi:hypothetical protein